MSFFFTRLYSLFLDLTVWLSRHTVRRFEDSIITEIFIIFYCVWIEIRVYEKWKKKEWYTYLSAVRLTSNEFFLIFAIFDNVGRLTHQSIRPYSVTFVSANPSFRSANCPYLSVRPVHFGVAVDPPIRSIGPSINLYPSILCHLPKCMHACMHTYPIYSAIYPTYPREPSTPSFLHLLPHFIYLFTYLPFRSRSPSSASRSHLDLTRRLDRPIARPFNSFSTPASPARVPEIPRFPDTAIL